MVIGSLSRRYAKALLAIGIDKKCYDSFGRELQRLVEALQQNGELRRVLASPLFSKIKRRNILEEVARRLALSPMMHNFVMVLLDKNRIAALPDIARTYSALVDEQAGRVRATVTAAKPIDPQLQTRLKAALEKQTGKTVLLEPREDPSIVGGLVTQVGDLVFDGSVRSQLFALREQLLAAK